MVKNQKIYRGIAVVNAADTREILLAFIRERHYQFCLYDNGGDFVGCNPDDPLVEKFYLSNRFIPEDFFPPEYPAAQRKLEKSLLKSWLKPSHRLAQCNEEFYAFLEIGLGMSMCVTAFFNTFIPYEEMYRHMSEGSELGLIPPCELFIEPNDPDAWNINIFSGDAAAMAVLAERYTAKNFQICRCMADDSGEAVYEFNGFLKTISRGSPPVPNRKFNRELYNQGA